MGAEDRTGAHPAGGTTISRQLSLFGSGDPMPDGAFSTLVRIHLDEVSWVDHAPGWMAGPDVVFEQILATCRWDRRRRWMYDRQVDEPRLTAGWNAAGGDVLRPPALESARAALGARYGVDFDSVGVNLYRGGADSVAWHRDRIPAVVEEPVVAILSLGEPRAFRLRLHVGPGAAGAAAGTSAVRTFLLGDGDLLVTGGQTQRRWEHSVPKRSRAGARISVAFRHGLPRPGAAPLARPDAPRRPPPG